LIVEKPDAKGFIGILACYSSKWSLIAHQVHKRAIVRDDFIEILKDVANDKERV
jgi:hypothetical protein